MNFIHRANSSHIHPTFVLLFNRRLAFPWDEICVWDLFAICHRVGVRKRERNTERIFKKKKITVVDGLQWREQDIDAILICVPFLLFLCSDSVQLPLYPWLLDHSVPLWSVCTVGGIDSGDYTPVWAVVTAKQACPALSCYTCASFHAQLLHNHDIISIKQLTSLRCLLFREHEILSSVIHASTPSNTCPFHGNLHLVKSSRVHYYELSFSGNITLL